MMGLSQRRLAVRVREVSSVWDQIAENHSSGARALYDPVSPVRALCLAAQRLALLFPVGLIAAACPGDIAQLESAHHNLEVVDILDSPSICRDCIALLEPTRLGDTVGPGALTTSTSVVIDSRGNYWVGQDYGEIKIFGRGGAYIRSVGRAGEGPMEFRSPRPLHVGDRGEVYVFDSPQRRVSVLSAAFELVSDYRLPGLVRSAALISSDRYVVNMWLPAEGHLGMPLHILRKSEIVESFGVIRERTEGLLTPFKGDRVVTGGSSGQIIAARRHDFLIEVWSAQAELLATYERAGFNDVEVVPGPFSESNPMPNHILGLRQRRGGRLWILWARVRDEWMDAFSERVRPDGSIGLVLTGELTDAYGTTLEILDLNTGKIIARRDYDGILSAFVGDSAVLEHRELDSGVPQLVVWTTRTRREIR